MNDPLTGEGDLVFVGVIFALCACSWLIRLAIKVWRR
jgi:hypothetical protein